MFSFLAKNNKWHYLILQLGVIICSCWAYVVIAADLKPIQGHFRHRPPDMVVDGDKFSGPLKDIIEEACKKAGYSIVWQYKPFGDSMSALKAKEVDLVPRVFKLKEREEYLHYMGPIGYQKKDISFLVKRGSKHLIRNSHDLEDMTIGVRESTAYTDSFDKNDKIKKVIAKTDADLLKLLQQSKVDAVIVLEKAGMDDAIAKMGDNNFVYASHKQQQRRGIYFVGPKDATRENMYNAIQAELMQMLERMEISLFYAKHNLYPPQQ